MTTFEFEELVANCNEKIENSNRTLNLYSLIVTKHEKHYSHIFNKEKYPNELWSISKVFLTVLLGILIDEKARIKGKPLSIDTKINTLIEELHHVSDVNIYELLTHTSGFKDPLMFSDQNLDKISLLEYISKSGFGRDKEKSFLYSNVGGYLISVILQRHLNKNLEELIYEKLLYKLNVSSFSWNKIDGYCSGATGLHLDAETIHKIGLILRDYGHLYKNKILNKEWIELMTSTLVMTPDQYNPGRVFPKFAHGLNLHICKDGTFYSDAKNGQYLIVNRESNIVCTIRADQSSKTSLVTECLRGFI